MSAATNPAQAEIDRLVKTHDVVLFMKGTRMFPQCGFSATVVNILNELVDEYETVNVLADPEIRAGIKTYSDWPTIPQLYVKQEFVGGCDIIKGMFGSGELHTLFGVEVEEVAPPEITVSEAAAATLTQAAAGEATPNLRFQISPTFQYGLSFGPKQPGDFEVTAGGLTFLFDRGSAKRANGLSLDFDEAGQGFRIDNPNEPASVKQITVQQLKAAMDADPALKLYDVRTDEEREIASIPGAVQLTPASQAEIMALPKDTRLVFHCHHGGRSQTAAEAFLREGFTDVSNVTGGITAWSREIDPDIPQY